METFIANTINGQFVRVWADDWAQAMGILNEDYPNLSDRIASWTTSTGLTMQMHDRKMVSHR